MDLTCQKRIKEVVYLAYVHTCPASLRIGITKEPNFSYGKSHCQGGLEVSDLRLLPNLGNFNDSVGGLANLMSLYGASVEMLNKVASTNHSKLNFHQ